VLGEKGVSKQPRIVIDKLSGRYSPRRSRPWTTQESLTIRRGVLVITWKEGEGNRQLPAGKTKTDPLRGSSEEPET